MPLNVSTPSARSARSPLPVALRPPRPTAMRPGWLTAMVVLAQEQCHRGTAPELPHPPAERRQQMKTATALVVSPPAPQREVRGTPRLSHIECEDLIDTTRLLELYAQAVQLRLIGSSEAARLTFVGLAQHVIAARPTNPGGLFRHLLYGKRYQCVTQADEDQALKRLKHYLYGRSESELGGSCCRVDAEGR